ncbi:MAG: adenylate/guanylate cyclase domain-containing protein, partial [Chloroflexota bacterium]|nr:adenylate/guanylate cyclase domain-containing protein [Chloroflexota bacterium]
MFAVPHRVGILQLWNKRIEYNAKLSTAVWAVFAVVAISGVLRPVQTALNSLILPTAGGTEEHLFWVVWDLWWEGMVMVILINNIRPAYSLLAPFSLLILYWLVAQLALHFAIRLDFFFTLIFGMVVYLANIIYNFLSFDVERRTIRKSFEFYLAPAYVDQVTENPEMLRLGGETREMTILFSDIRSFSTFSEKLAPDTLVSFLNQYFTPMTDIVMAEKGVVDKYIGDA